MATMLFVHGTGVREGYEDDLARIREELALRQPKIVVAPCHWAAAELRLRADLTHNGVSIPSGRFARGEEQEEDIYVSLWGQLYLNPLYELHLLALLAPETTIEQGCYRAELEELCNRLATFVPSADLIQLLMRAGLYDSFTNAAYEIAASTALSHLITDGVQDPELIQSAIGRAVIAKAIQDEQVTRSTIPLVAIDGDLRDSLIIRFSLALSSTSADRGIQECVGKGVATLLSHGATWYLRRNSAMATHFAFPFSGDILRYQRAGTTIRNFIRDQIMSADPPIIVLAHSLGGVICFDLLCLEDLSSRVRGLITVGSQAPLLYEMNVLAGLAADKPLPSYFPHWLNIYDCRDMLSFIGSKMFPGKVVDLMVDNRQPFPNAHISYWTNSQLWDEVGKWIEQMS